MLEKQISQMKDLFGGGDTAKGPVKGVDYYISPKHPQSTSTNADRKRKKAKRQARKASKRRG